MKIYKDKSNPLVEVPLYELEDTEIYVTDEGVRFRFEENKQLYDVIQASELNMGEYLEDLTPGEAPNSLGLYWKLMKNKAKKY